MFYGGEDDYSDIDEVSSEEEESDGEGEDRVFYQTILDVLIENQLFDLLELISNCNLISILGGLYKSSGKSNQITFIIPKGNAFKQINKIFTQDALKGRALLKTFILGGKITEEKLDTYGISNVGGVNYVYSNGKLQDQNIKFITLTLNGAVYETNNLLLPIDSDGFKKMYDWEKEETKKRKARSRERESMTGGAVFVDNRYQIFNDYMSLSPDINVWPSYLTSDLVTMVVNDGYMTIETLAPFVHPDPFITAHSLLQHPFSNPNIPYVLSNDIVDHFIHSRYYKSGNYVTEYTSLFNKIIALPTSRTWSVSYFKPNKVAAFRKRIRELITEKLNAATTDIEKSAILRELIMKSYKQLEAQGGKMFTKEHMRVFKEEVGGFAHNLLANDLLKFWTNKFKYQDDVNLIQKALFTRDSSEDIISTLFGQRDDSTHTFVIPDTELLEFVDSDMYLYNVFLTNPASYRIDIASDDPVTRTVLTIPGAQTQAQTDAEVEALASTVVNAPSTSGWEFTY